MVILRISLVSPASSDALPIFYLLNLGIEDAFNKLTAQTIDKMVAEGG